MQHLQLTQGVPLNMGLTISLCDYSDVDNLISFIDSDWKNNHIFVRDRELFDWQHKGKDCYHFVVAKDGDDIIGILGYIPLSQYSSLLIENNELWLAIWKVKDGVKKPGLGLMMLNFLNKMYNKPTICSLGLSSHVIPIYKALKYKVGILEHHAFFNQDFNTFSIGNPGERYLASISKNNFKYEVSDNIATIPESFFFNYPKKNNEYIKNRYINHPRYSYKFLSIHDDEKLLSVSVYREIIINNAKIGRIVDSFGENIMNQKFNFAISNFLYETRYEYLDLVSNLPRSSGSGFIKSSESVIIPNYFEPFEMRNVKIDYAYKANKDLVIFRGDSDQDRPNI
ncbi:hypothetical protein [Plesiomonas shigelloides]|uniref:hypothetical protein n=1 Tax=Plesiomonas shigelloides TaxID=703 RepID=UPI001261B3A9|nr:hypothetical protein [Plesiomonas shigelloides]KAB7672275.1 hypothetical protein GBN16_16425 [Plesiomonas shigelloides]